ncbi:hypothetical protein F2Q69_00059489 [Brassica cretica]|uniref:Uncharacterized protein n=1 Tax=Brassica cretica TaxID=69181 RepID=A0A8S9RLI4_BRACR|nr:hypothetical protein F2Q69_00059489 [Brassica cretica]
MCATGRPLTRRPHGCRGRGQPSTPSSRSPRATGVISLAVATGHWRHLPRSCHGRPTSPPSRLPRATGTRLPRGRHGRPVPRLSGSPRGDQLLVLPGRHGAVGATLTDNPSVMFNVPLMLPLENYDKTTKVRLSTNSNGPCETTMVNLNRVGRIAGFSIQQNDAVSRTPSREIIRKQTNKGPKLGSKLICKEKIPRIS